MKYEVSIIIPTYNKVNYTRRCLEALATYTPGDLYEVIIVDNGSTDATRGFLKSLEGDVRLLLNPLNQGFARACNAGAEVAQGRLLLFLNNDTEPLPGWLNNLLAVAAAEPQIGAVGCKLLFPDDTVQHAGVVVGLDPITGQLHPYHLYYRFDGLDPLVNRQRDLQAVTGACLLIPKDLFSELGGFDERYYNGYEDVDLCFRVRQEGHRVIYTPRAKLIHHESISGPERFRKSRENLEILNSRWLGRIPPDETRIYVEDGLVVRYEEHQGTLSKSIDHLRAVPVVVPAGSASADTHRGQVAGGHFPQMKLIVLDESPPARNLGATLSKISSACDGVLFWGRPGSVDGGLLVELLANLTLAPYVGAVKGPDAFLLRPELAGPVADIFLTENWEERMGRRVESWGYRVLALDRSGRKPA
ncbi:MAG: glycosyltransferase family 2 protein [Bacillota bacterium]|nr:glycosyltransferase family 2 protein [Bacillota bacterium]